MISAGNGRDHPAADPLPSAQASTTLLVGRERELATIRAACSSALEGGGSLILVSGEAGIGKTALVRQVRSEFGAGETAILSGACYDLTTTPPYGPWLDALQQVSVVTEGAPSPSFMSDSDSLDAFPSQQALFDETFRLLRHLAQSRPVLVILEDLHWSDQASLDMLRFIARNIRGHSIALVTTYRDDEITREHPLFLLLPSLIREAPAQRVELRRLSDDDTRALIARWYPMPAADLERLNRFLHKRTEGNPLFVNEILRSLEIDGFLSSAGNSWQLHNLESGAVPNLIRQIVEGRLSSAGQPARSLIQAASVIGEQVPLADIAPLLQGIDDARLLEEVEATGLVEPFDRLGQVRFRHALVREAVYEQIPLLTRYQIHGEVAESLLQHRDPEPGQVAYHLRRAGDRRAGGWLIQAGEKAERRFAWHEAFDRYREGLDALREASGTEAEIAGLLLKTGRLLRYFNPQLGNEYLQAARSTALEFGDHTIAAAAQFNIGNNLCNMGEMVRGLNQMRDAAESLSQKPQEAQRIVRWSQTSIGVGIDPIRSWQATLSLMLATAGRFQDAISFAENSLGYGLGEANTARIIETIKTGTQSGVNSFESIGIAKSALGQPNDASRAFELARESLVYLNYLPYMVIIANQELVTTHFPYRTDDLGHREYLTKIIEDHLDISEGMVDRHNAMWGYEHSFVYTGRWRELRNLIEHTPCPTLFDYWFISTSARARLSWYLGDHDRAWARLYELLPDGPSTEPDGMIHIVPAEPHRIAAGIAIDAEDSDLARRWMTAHDQWLDWSGASLGRAEGKLNWARICFLEGDIDVARSHARDALTTANDPAQPIAMVGVRRFMGQLEMTSGDAASAASHLQSSLDLAETCQLPFERALTLLQLAELSLAHGNEDTARRYLNEVQDISHRLGATSTRHQAEQMLQSIGGAGSEDRVGLSRRERDVLVLIAQGMTDRQVAERLFISHRTVMRHVSNILRKLQVESRTAAAAQAVSQGLVDPGA